MNPFQDRDSIAEQFPDHLQVQEFDDPLKKKLYAYRGTSMFPTLKEPDALEILPYEKNTPQVGDVVVCLPPEHDDYVVHRITRITAQGVFTEGDYSRTEDPWILQKADIAGRVVSVWRGSKRRNLPGGLVGIFQFRINRLWTKVVRRFSLFVRPCYQLICNSGLVHRLLPHQFRPRVIRFNQQGTIALRLIWLDKVIGSYSIASNSWQIKPPYRLVVDPELLKQFQFH